LKLKLLFLADGRSPIALNWIQHFIAAGHEVHLASTFPAEPLPGAASHTLAPVAFSGAAGGTAGGGKWLKQAASPLLRARLRQWLGVLTLPRAARRLTGLIHTLQPDLIHAMRIPYEGMAAALADPPAPLLISIWGNDLTLHAPASPMMRRRTRHALARADAIHADCRADVRRAREWGFAAGKPFVVLPGGGGVQPDIFYPPAGNLRATSLPAIINPRGMRAYVHNREFFEAIPLVLEAYPDARFVCTGMAGEAQAEAWVREFGVAGAVELLPRVPRAQMGGLFRGAQVAVSLTSHDGTPNTLLEAMACGCYPVAGDLESIREWIEPGKNGALVNPARPAEIAGGIIAALGDAARRDYARQINFSIIRERAEHAAVMQAAEAFYRALVMPAR
jgi:glycosyltransferase involved in cell wall biosynthesis